MKIFLAWDGEAKRLFVVRAESMDAASDVLAERKDGSDGDEFSLLDIANTAAPCADVTDLLIS